MYDSESSRWQALQTRDEAATSAFVYAVITTKIYCRPACPARLARRANVCFYDTAGEAAAAGYRPCLRCTPDQPIVQADAQSGQREAVRKACKYIEQTQGRAKFSDVAKHVGLSKRYLYGLFKTVMVTTPAKYAERFKSEGTVRVVSETPSAVSGAVSPTNEEFTQPAIDPFTWNALLDFNHASSAFVYDNTDLASQYDAFCIDPILIASVDSKSLTLSDPWEIWLSGQDDSLMADADSLDPTLDMFQL